MAHHDTTEVFFLVDGKRLESQAALLAPSLKHHLTPSQKAVAYVREDYIDELEDFTRDVLTASEIEIRLIPDTRGGHAPWQAPYPQGNKILAAAQPRDCEVSVFIDTDTILAEPTDFAGALGDALMAACISDYASSTGTQEDWEGYYAVFDLPLPEDRIQLQGGRRLMSLPYFNAGLVVFRERLKDGTPTEFGQKWLDAALKFERGVTRDYTRSNIDQFTLPILGYLLDRPVKPLDQHLNFNIQAYGNGEGQRQSVVHYHQIGALWKHDTHGRAALDMLVAVTDASAPEMFLEVYGLHARRKNLKHHLRAMAAA